MKEHQQLGTAQQSFYAARQAHNILAREQNARASTKPRANQIAFETQFCDTPDTRTG